MSGPVTITFNGVEKAFEDLGDAPTVAVMLTALGFRADRVALERNGEIVTRAEWPETPVVSGDRIELVHFVGGGS